MDRTYKGKWVSSRRNHFWPFWSPRAANPERLAHLENNERPVLLTLLDGSELLLSEKQGTGPNDLLRGCPWAPAKLEMVIQSGNVWPDLGGNKIAFL